ncbi:FHA domain-containing protein [Streptomyces geranii]|uniref:FHA domain-containing protein n=1 Tax=Streptomyces geranii TaxID=2058923 RepID=UPI000D040C40|nr:FHA domain-containing protein [Streptomyces geranii]
MPTCPNGHQSGSDDWCEVCGHRMAGAVPPPPPPPPAPGYGYPPPGSATGAPGSRSHLSAVPDSEPELCPQCRTPREGGAPFCEECRWNFLTNTATSYTPAAPRPPAPGPGQGYGGGPVGAGPGQQRYQPPPPGPSYGGGDGYDYQSSRPSQMNRPAEPIPPFGGDPSRPVPPPPGPTPGVPGGPGGTSAGGPQGYPPNNGPGGSQGYPPTSGGPQGYPPQGGPDGYGGPGGAPQAFQPSGPHSPPSPPAFPQETGRRGGPQQGGGFGGDDDWVISPPSGGPSGPPPPQQGGYGYPQPGVTQAPPGGGYGQQRPLSWSATIGPDREYFMAMMQRSGPEAAGLNLPAYSPEQQRALTGNQITIGRRRHSTGESPDIDLAVPPEDPGVSHQHAVLVQQPDGSWAVVDQNSTNGTTVNNSEEPIQPFVPVPLQDGDRVHVGAWTTITIRRG